MFTDLINCLKKNGLYIEKEILSFENCPCHTCDCLALEFNEIAIEFYKRIKQEKPPTVNALYFKSSDCLYFIEMTFYYTAIEDFHDKFLSSVNPFSLNKKIEGTINTLNNINSNYQCDNELLEKLNGVKTILLCDINDQDFVRIRTAYLDKFNILSYGSTFGEIGIFNCDTFISTLN